MESTHNFPSKEITQRFFQDYPFSIKDYLDEKGVSKTLSKLASRHLGEKSLVEMGLEMKARLLISDLKKRMSEKDEEEDFSFLGNPLFLMSVKEAAKVCTESGGQWVLAERVKPLNQRIIEEYRSAHNPCVSVRWPGERSQLCDLLYHAGDRFQEEMLQKVRDAARGRFTESEARHELTLSKPSDKWSAFFEEITPEIQQESTKKLTCPSKFCVHSGHAVKIFLKTYSEEIVECAINDVARAFATMGTIGEKKFEALKERFTDRRNVVIDPSVAERHLTEDEAKLALLKPVSVMISQIVDDISDDLVKQWSEDPAPSVS